MNTATTIDSTIKSLTNSNKIIQNLCEALQNIAIHVENEQAKDLSSKFDTMLIASQEKIKSLKAERLIAEKRELQARRMAMQDNARQNFIAATPIQARMMLMQYIVDAHYQHGHPYWESAEEAIANSSNEELSNAIKMVLSLTSNKGYGDGNGDGNCWCCIGDGNAIGERNDLTDYLNVAHDKLNYCGYLEGVIIFCLETLIQKR